MAIESRIKEIKMNENRSYRMYGLVPYNLSPIQQGIQFGHAVVEYQQNYGRLLEGNQETELMKQYNQWAENDKTFIILNGGTTSRTIREEPIQDSNHDGLLYHYVGSLNNHMEWLIHYDIPFASFYEPDLGDQLTAIVFLVDDRVWDTQWHEDVWNNLKGDYEEGFLDYDEMKDKYIEMVGGRTNVELFRWLQNFRLA